MNGYHGKFLQVDLSTKEIKEMNLREDDLRMFIGGSTLAAKLIYDHVQPDMDPLAPKSPLIFATGPFTGTTIPMVSRSAVCGVSPLTGIWGEATTGGKFPVRLKGSGYDGIFITGKADAPVYLFVSDNKVEAKDASAIWGKDTYEIQDILKQEIGEQSISVSCIGPAGENLVKYANVMNDEGRAAGRCGLGALMGSKNLKAVIVAGKQKTELADKEKLKEAVKDAQNWVANHMNTNVMRVYGTNAWIDLGMRLGDVPTKYFTKSVFPPKKVAGSAFMDNYKMGSYACQGCLIGCGRVVKDFKADIKKVDGPEYETTAALGPLCMNFDTDSIIMANHLCNAYGMDTISAGVCIAFAMHLYEKGILTKEKAGMEIEWGDGPTIVKLVHMINKQEGIGRLLAQGTRQMAEELGVDQNEAAHVKGLELPMHDPRAFVGTALCYAIGPRGACHNKGDFHQFDLPIDGEPELGLFPGDKNLSPGKAEVVLKQQSYCEIYNSLTLCEFSQITAPQICTLLNSITGWETRPLDLLTFGERSLNLKRAINNKLGITRADDKLPKIAIAPLKEGATADRSPDMGLMLKEFYEISKWDWETGKPTKEKLLELGLEKAAEDLWAS